MLPLLHHAAIHGGKPLHSLDVSHSCSALAFFLLFIIHVLHCVDCLMCLVPGDALAPSVVMIIGAFWPIKEQIKAMAVATVTTEHALAGLAESHADESERHSINIAVYH